MSIACDVIEYHSLQNGYHGVGNTSKAMVEAYMVEIIQATTEAICDGNIPGPHFNIR